MGQIYGIPEYESERVGDHGEEVQEEPHAELPHVCDFVLCRYRLVALVLRVCGRFLVVWPLVRQVTESLPGRPERKAGLQVHE